MLFVEHLEVAGVEGVPRRPGPLGTGAGAGRRDGWMLTSFTGTVTSCPSGFTRASWLGVTYVRAASFRPGRCTSWMTTIISSNSTGSAFPSAFSAAEEGLFGRGAAEG